MRPDRNTWLFLLLCAIWGSTWIGIKAGVDAVPPLFFAGTRFTAAGLILLGFSAWQGSARIARRDWGRAAACALLMITLCYGPLFWGMRHIDSGTAAVLELGLTPVALLGFALALREERFARIKILAIGMGLGGLVVLFGPVAAESWTSGDRDASLQVWGALAVASAAIIYGAGSVVARPLLRTYPSTLLAGATTLIGGIALLALSFAFEPESVQALRGDWGWAAWSGWVFLVLFGSLVGYTIYMQLLRDIGASRAGAYAFVSPVIAVGLGVMVMGETVSLLDGIGMVILLAAAWLAMTGKQAPPEIERTAQVS
ncbi:EamA family transporter [uncultured Jannaschia sp.]|uniref:DMT family transporter n=1 Tax=uncultured Jannaschia sp. TaxID=293347 RepID=UPI00262C9E38|nr:EamA family transporter [uncultured Jannaschia sp.]